MGTTEWEPKEAQGKGQGGGERGADESGTMDVAPAAVWRHSAQPGRGSRIRCVQWNQRRAQQTPDTRHQTPPARSMQQYQRSCNCFGGTFFRFSSQ